MTENPGGRARIRSNDWVWSAQQSFTPAMLGNSASRSSVSFAMFTPVRYGML